MAELSKANVLLLPSVIWTEAPDAVVRKKFIFPQQ